MRKEHAFRSRLRNPWKLPRDRFSRQDETDSFDRLQNSTQISRLRFGTVDFLLTSEHRTSWFESYCFWLVLSLVLISNGTPTTVTFLVVLVSPVRPRITARGHSLNVCVCVCVCVCVRVCVYIYKLHSNVARCVYHLLWVLKLWPAKQAAKPFVALCQNNVGHACFRQTLDWYWCLGLCHCLVLPDRLEFILFSIMQAFSIMKQTTDTVLSDVEVAKL
jgi:hypothetical protein